MKKDISFTWSKDKAEINLAKHGVSFDEAVSVFYDEEARLIDDPSHSVRDERFIIMGLSSKLRLLIVCHCYRDNDSVVRIISARKANKSEAHFYGGFI
jgi:uncharacterized DUF497 family protein